MSKEVDSYIAGRELSSEVERAGFCINEKKTRIQYQNSRQDVTGLVVNKKPNVKKEYWRIARAQCNKLFKSGQFTKTVNDKVVEGNINELEGKLNFIDHIDTYNRLRQAPPLNQTYEMAKHGHNKSKLLSGRERTFSRFLYYRLFYGNNKPTIVCEGKTDNTYLKSAINRLAGEYPKLADSGLGEKGNKYKLLVHFLKYTKRTRFLLELYGGTSYLNYFISKFDKQYKYYGAPKPDHPVIILLDNDSGFDCIDKTLRKMEKVTAVPLQRKKQNFRNAEFIHVIHNLYIVLTPIDMLQQESMIEDLFDDETKKIEIAGKRFNPEKNFDKNTEYSKEVFAKKVVLTKKYDIDFNGFKPFLDRIVKAIDHYGAMK